MKENSKALKITKITLNLIFYTIVALMLIYSIIIIVAKGNNNIPNIFGKGFLAVETDSMVGENKDSFNPGDLIFVTILSDKAKDNLKVGDVITFKDQKLGGAINTHRINRVFESGFVETKGDNENSPDTPLTSKANVLAIYSGKIPRIGFFFIFLQSQLGFGLVVILPIFLMLVYQGYLLFSNIFELKKEKAKEELSLEKDKMREELLESEKERIRQELLKELQEEKDKNKDK